MVKTNLDFELTLWKEHNLIVGVDETGRGALAGPIVVAAVILPIYFRSPLIQDSKILKPWQRNKAYEIIRQKALEYSIIIKSPREVENKNPLQATKEAMVEATLKLKNKPSLCLVDGKEEIIISGIPTQSIIGGDRKSINIAAASIIAKVTRDAIMKNLHKKYPRYDWENNKGYPNPTHLQAIFKHGICSLHRKTYEPIKSLVSGKMDKQEIARKYNLIT
ncbi:ribonuclease HII [endosymbiont GvMRE of Glomus versiforme]|uniref:ribonuclease HII n=1 Tax=endosymbiont GvMRE of Glomus versiforme TaxID=2039283 RepID=UPI000EE45589|nr:ribonuclease HII [endosymbiont GvMRE of Glomus versiforme]RHZ37240.1 Ribonuclease HII [endosymbiont GvMRE of Glomus versiforme]